MSITRHALSTKALSVAGFLPCYPSMMSARTTWLFLTIPSRDGTAHADRLHLPAWLCGFYDLHRQALLRHLHHEEPLSGHTERDLFPKLAVFGRGVEFDHLPCC